MVMAGKLSAARARIEVSAKAQRNEVSFFIGEQHETGLVLRQGEEIGEIWSGRWVREFDNFGDQG